MGFSRDDIVGAAFRRRAVIDRRVRGQGYGVDTVGWALPLELGDEAEVATRHDAGEVSLQSHLATVAKGSEGEGIHSGGSSTTGG